MTVVDERAVAAPETEEAVAVIATTEPVPVVDKGLIAQLVGDGRAAGTAIDGEGGLLSQLTKLVVEAALEGEMTAHLGYQKHERTLPQRAGRP